MSGKPILIVGSIGLDTIETISDRRESILGGSATYATVSAGKSADVHLVGIIGTDFPAEGIKIFLDSSSYRMCLVSYGLVCACFTKFNRTIRIPYHKLSAKSELEISMENEAH